MKTYICPICGYDGLDAPPYEIHSHSASYDICPCCYFEYGYSEDHEVDLGYIVTPVDMREAAFQLYRKQWIEKGAVVGSPENYPKEFQEDGKVKQETVLKQLNRLNLPLDNLTFLEEYDI
ncbi:hypothetical protein HXA34_05745 [Salipaludibacillus agaradhaerens]|uniref:hypothetical protein n=1 Tax=Salipaludibacillus agaradhaerens TaxID=76935 RepID=UPI0021513555|nr:hypothetical protein [Salipaludibacillus agaradhaerens]MCR6105792.1 hypothetical protein [Salipaludibacillus agaradhaerens]MCR6117828.1 hypothetical protein [Salipaludibacillus agaradhaerens]UJW56992.1 hypothetical protein HXZ66_05945 [Bacillus sp. A116_S68]